MRRLVGVCILVIAALAFIAVFVFVFVFVVKSPNPDVTPPRKTLSWNPSPNAEIYTVKCGTERGRYTMPPVVVKAPATQLPVQAVIKQPGTYFCVVTASNASGESSPSNEIVFSY